MTDEITRVLNALEDGDSRDTGELLPLVYAELRKLAASKLAHETPGQTLDATALVHEAYLRLIGSEDQAQWDNKGHFFAAAAESMRRILIDNARRKQSIKRGGEHKRQEFDADRIVAPEFPLDLLDLDEALTKLEGTDQSAAQVVKLRYFGGLTIPQVAKAMGISPRSADRLWAYARAWLHVAIHGPDKKSADP